MTLLQYIKKRNGVALGGSNSLRNMLHRSLGAKNFSTFWNYWNPIFGYYLGKYVFKPLKSYFPSTIALVFTFIFCGLLHDAVTTTARGSISLFFSTWFLLMGIGVVVSRTLKHDFSSYPWILRAFINLLFIGLCLSATVFIDNNFKIT